MLRIDALSFTDHVQRAQRAEGILDARWWTLLKLRGTSAAVFPDDLATRLATITARRGT